MEGKVVAPDGRTVTFCEWGDPAGEPVFVLHGTPGSRLSRHPDETVFRRAGVRAITFDRPGYGQSTRLAGRRVADAPADVAAIADELGLARFAVTGASGGGPHSLACGALLTDRVTRCATVGGAAPLGPSGMAHDDFFHGMAAQNVAVFERALAGEEALRPHLERTVRELRATLAAASAGGPLDADLDMSRPDRDVINQQAIGAMLVASIREGIDRTIDGYVDDHLALTRPWGFDVAAVGVPTAVWVGPQDTFIPPTHSEWLARAIDGAEITVLSGGHFAVYGHLDRLLRWLVGRA